MTSLIFGVGVGLFILISVWSVAVFLGLVSLRTRHKIGGVAVIIALIITVILSLIPLDSKAPPHVVHKVYDEVFILRSSLLVLLTISSVAGSVSCLVKHLMELRLARPLKDKRT